MQRFLRCRAVPMVGMLVSLICAGCQPSAPAKPVAAKPATTETGTAAPNEGAPQGDGPAAADSDAMPAAKTSEPSSEPTPTGTSAVTEPSSGDEPAEASNKVLLGVDELYAGIPGSGPLELVDVEHWFEDPKNNQVLDFELPLGLSAGKDQVQGVKENPLTRAKIELGRQLYFDPRLSADNSVSCASCHTPDEGFARHTQFGVGISGQLGGRNSPPSYNRILSGAQFWDGRAKSLEDQAVGPIANPIEMGNTHEECVSTIKKSPVYEREFQLVFGELTIDAVAKAIATFERTLVTGPSAYDYEERLRPFADMDIDELKEDDPELYQKYLSYKEAAEEHPMSDSAKRGRDIFFGTKGNCTACHVGANFTDEKYHNLGVGMDVDDEHLDRGREVVTKEDKELGAFKTPTIRNVEHSAPYMHDGSQKTLEEVVEWYAKGGHPNPHLDEKIKKLDLTDQDKQDLVAFMKACSGDFPKVERGRFPE
jgi:cytochrome c peroxidase